MSLPSKRERASGRPSACQWVIKLGACNGPDTTGYENLPARQHRSSVPIPRNRKRARCRPGTGGRVIEFGGTKRIGVGTLPTNHQNLPIGEQCRGVIITCDRE